MTTELQKKRNTALFFPNSSGAEGLCEQSQIAVRGPALWKEFQNVGQWDRAEIFISFQVSVGDGVVRWNRVSLDVPITV